MGTEFYNKGADVQLGPGVNVARVPVNGRNFEYLSGEDPYLGYVLVQGAVNGIQDQGVMANAKHYVDNSQELERFTVSEHIDERTQHEIYYPPFEGTIEAGVGSFMCSYNRVNDAYACENNSTLNTDLRETLGFEGFVMSDWGATHSLSVEQGLDQEMGFDEENEFYNAEKLADLPTSMIDESMSRIFTQFFKIGAFDHEKPGNLSSNVTTTEHKELSKKIASESTVLLKNEN